MAFRPKGPGSRRLFTEVLMKHHAFAAVGLLTAAFLVPGAPSHAASADPTGFWVKPGSERNAKIQVRKCGKGLCANIVWRRLRLGYTRVDTGLGGA